MSKFSFLTQDDIPIVTNAGNELPEDKRDIILPDAPVSCQLFWADPNVNNE